MLMLRGNSMLEREYDLKTIMYPAYGTHYIMRTMWGKHTQITRKQSEYRGKTRCQSKPPILAWLKWGGGDNSTPLWSVVFSWGWRPTWGIMTSSNGNIFRVTGHLCGEFTDNQWITHTKASDAVLWWVFFICLICAWINGWVNDGEVGDLRRHCAHHDVTVTGGILTLPRGFARELGEFHHLRHTSIGNVCVSLCVYPL